MCTQSLFCRNDECLKKTTHLSWDESVDKKCREVHISHHCPPKISFKRIFPRYKAVRSVELLLSRWLISFSHLTSLRAILSGKGRAVNVFHHLETTWNSESTLTIKICQTIQFSCMVCTANKKQAKELIQTTVTATPRQCNQPKQQKQQSKQQQPAKLHKVFPLASSSYISDAS